MGMSLALCPQGRAALALLLAALALLLATLALLLHHWPFFSTLRVLNRVCPSARDQWADMSDLASSSCDCDSGPDPVEPTEGAVLPVGFFAALSFEGATRRLGYGQTELLWPNTQE
jgi:hypothetical protein